MKVLFIGGTGILSKDVALLAAERGMDVYMLNRGTRKQFIDDRYHVLIADIRKPETVIKAVGELKFDVVIDFLSYNTEQMMSTLGIFNGSCKQYIFISSATVYKHSKENEVFSEAVSEAGNDRWSYAKAKYDCECMLKSACEEQNQIYTIIRPYVTYGNTRFPYALIPQNEQWSLADRILRNRAIPVWDGGKAVCTLTNTKDFAVGLVGLMGNEMAYNEVFHITGSETLTWREVVEQTAQALGREAKIVDISLAEISRITPEYAQLLSGDKATDMVFNNEKIRRAVPEFKGEITFKEGIAETVEFYKSHPDMQIVNYKWNGRIDYLIDKGCKNIQKEYIGMPENISAKQKLAYIEGRYRVVAAALRMLRKLKGKI